MKTLLMGFFLWVVLLSLAWYKQPPRIFYLWDNDWTLPNRPIVTHTIMHYSDWRDSI